MRRGAALPALIGGGLGLLAVVPAVAVAGSAVTPESGGSPGADDTETLYRIVLYVAIAVFLLVEGALVWSLVRFRARRGDAPPEQVRGSTRLEMGWTLAAATVLVALTAVTFAYLDPIKNPPASGPGGLTAGGGAVQYASLNQPKPPGDDFLEIGVSGQQYLWRYDYPGRTGELFSYHELIVPARTTVTLTVTSQDVVHSWWVPELGGKVDAVPGYENETWFKVSKPGVYTGVCAELCGEGHAEMRTRVRALEPAAYRRWARAQRQDIADAKRLLAESRRRGETQ